ncbi:placenta-specific gene 8 protein-like [Apostichopus japonicus]|uniref:placenta-specific gene 8 protein-like n=1 Tax=Stichopus japonicus TaxID=307972 RepID=UPI003AB82395
MCSTYIIYKAKRDYSIRKASPLNRQQPTDIFYPSFFETQREKTVNKMTTTTVITNQPMTAGGVVVRQEREWSTGLCGCFEDITSCLCAFCLLPCMECWLASHADEFVCLPLCVPAASIAVRTKIRTLYGIRGSICEDCLYVSLCAPCALAQTKREIDNVKMGRA